MAYIVHAIFFYNYLIICVLNFIKVFLIPEKRKKNM